MDLNWMGFLVGLSAFIMIGLFHPVVARMEYHLGKKSWWMLFLPGLICLVVSFFVSPLLSVLTGCLAFSFFWSTLEIFMQHKRVLQGRAKANPERIRDYGAGPIVSDQKTQTKPNLTDA